MGRKRGRNHGSKQASKTRAPSGSSRQTSLQKDAPAPLSDSTPVNPPRRLGRPLFFGVLGVLLLFVLILKSYSLNAYPGDEFIYIFQAKLVGEGVTPYRDFAMAHPPVQALVTAVLLKLFGQDLLALRLMPIGWFILGGVALAMLARRELGDTAGLLAPFLYLTAHEPLRAASHLTGVNMTVTLLILAVYCYRGGGLKKAALFSVLAVFTRLYAIPAVAVLTIFALIADRKGGIALIKYGAIMGGAAVLLFGLWTGFGDMIHNLLVYHAQKTPMNPESLADMKLKVLFHNATLASLFALAVCTLLFVLHRATAATRADGRAGPFHRAVRRSNTGLVVLSAAIALLMLLLLTSMDRIWMYYFIPSFPFAALVAAWMIDRLIEGGIAWFRSWRDPAVSAPPKSARWLGVTAAALFAIAFAASPMLEAGLIYYKAEMRKPPEARVHRYTFHPSPLPALINGWVRANFWQDERVIGEPYTVFNYYLWHESRVFDIVDEVVDLIKTETEPGDTIFGDSGTVPMFALLSGRGIAGYEVDTNLQRYRSGNADPKALLSKIDNDKTKMIILRHRFGVSGVQEVRRLVETKYRRLKRIRSDQGLVFEIFKRKAVKESTS